MKAAFFFITMSFGFLISCGESNQKDIEKSMVGSNPESQTFVRAAGEGTMSAGYFTYTNSLSEPDTLFSVSSKVARMTESHETYTTADGLSGMREVKEIPVAAGDSIQFKPGGLHIMFMRLTQDLAHGDSVEVELSLKKAGKVNVTLAVQ